MVAGRGVQSYRTLQLAGWVWVAVAAAGVVGPIRTDARAAMFIAHYTDLQGQGFYDPTLGVQRRKAFEFALSIWGSRIPNSGSASVDVFASFESLGGTSTSAVLGSAGPSAFTANFTGGRSNTAYASALANYLSGGDLTGGDADISITFNSDIDGLALGSRKWYYGLDLKAKGGDPDFVTVALHELTHSMGFISTADASGGFGVDTGPRGSLPDIFDRYLVNSLGGKVVNLSPLPRNVTQATYWGGTLGVREYDKAFGRGRPAMYVPSTFSAESSLSHLDENTFVGTSDLMTPYLSNAVHTPDDVVRGIMADIGWQSAGSGDANLSGRVDVLDLLTVVNRFGKSFGDADYLGAADVNADGAINMQDLTLAIGQFGQADMLGQLPTASSLFGAGAPLVWSADAYRVTIRATVPEPVTVVLLLAGVAAMARRRAYCWRFA